MKPRGLMTTRQEVYAAIDSEREHQIRTDRDHPHEIGSFLVFMGVYMDQARAEITMNEDPKASQQALVTLRKMLALGVACMEQHGAPKR